MTIPRIMHQIWIGPHPPPSVWMDTWKANHSDWTYRIWSNTDLASLSWSNRTLISYYYRVRMYNAVADLMRYEILHRHGGAVIAADSVCLHPIDELFEYGGPLYAISTEYPGNRRPANVGALAPLYAAEPGHAFTKLLITTLMHTRQPGPATRTTGNRFMQRMVRKHRPPITVWPMHYFIPEHFNGWKYDGPDKVYAKHFWGTTRNTYTKGRTKNHGG